MYAVVITAHAQPDHLTDAVATYQEHFVPLMRQRPGFQRLQILADQGTNTALVIVHYDTAEHAAAVPDTEPWRQARVSTAAYVLGPPTVQIWAVIAEA